MTLTGISVNAFNVSINRLFAGEKLGPQAVDKRWPRFTGGFQNETHTLDSLIRELSLGHAVCCVLGSCDDLNCSRPFGWRQSSHFVETSLLYMDHATGDEASSIPHLSADPFIKSYSAYLYSTPSSTPEYPKSRVVYQVAQAISDPINYRRAVLALLYRYPSADRSTHDPARFFYGAKPGTEIVRLGNILPLATLDELVRKFEAHLDREVSSRPLPKVDPSRIVGHTKLERYVSAVIQGEMALVSSAKEGVGERHLSILKAAKSLGPLVLSTWLPAEIRATIDPYALLIPHSRREWVSGQLWGR